MKKLEFVIRRNDPFQNDHGSWDNEDINTLAADMLFEGVCTTLQIGPNEKISFVGGENKVFNYDVVQGIDGHCYVRESEIKPGAYHEKWREPTDHEMDEFINLMRGICEREKVNINDDMIYNWYVSKRRDRKIETVLK